MTPETFRNSSRIIFDSLEKSLMLHNLIFKQIIISQVDISSRTDVFGLSLIMDDFRQFCCVKIGKKQINISKHPHILDIVTTYLKSDMGVVLRNEPCIDNFRISRKIGCNYQVRSDLYLQPNRLSNIFFSDSILMLLLSQ